MKLTINRFLTLLFFFISLVSKTQEPFNVNQPVLSDVIENIAASTDQEHDYALLYEDLIYYAENPLNINDANTEELQKLHILTDYQIASLHNYINNNGPLLSKYELQVVYGFDVQLIRKLETFITIQPPTNKTQISLKNSIKYGRHQIFLRTAYTFEEQTGFSDIPDSVIINNPDKNRYLGIPYKAYTRYTFNYHQKLHLGFVAENDPGEELFTGSNRNHFDYQSAHFFLNKKGIIKKIALGDYQASFGQGLVLWSGMSFGKSPYVLNNSKHGRGLYKYTSTNENQFMRGAAGTFDFKNFDFTLFYSRKNIDANITRYDSVKNIVKEVSSLQNSGLHATPAQINDENVLNEQLAGGHLSYHATNYKVGATLINYSFNAILKNNHALYNYYDFEGQQNINAGIDYKIMLKGTYFFGESAISQNLGYATINGLNYKLFPGFDMALIHRYYKKNYQALYGNAFGENADNANETGIYTGIKANIIPKWTFSAFIDIFEFPWLKYYVDAPSFGTDYHLQADYTVSDAISMYWRFKYGNKQRNTGWDSLFIDYPLNVQTTKFRYHIAYKVTDALYLKNRIELLNYNKPEHTEQGYMVYQDLQYRKDNFPFIISLRYAIFDTDSYYARIYAYENDLLYAFSVPAYFYKGTRTYLLIKYDINHNIDLWLKCGQTYFSNKKTIGSGLNKIKGNRKTTIKGQLKMKF